MFANEASKHIKWEVSDMYTNSDHTAIMLTFALASNGTPWQKYLSKTKLGTKGIRYQRFRDCLECGKGTRRRRRPLGIRCAEGTSCSMRRNYAQDEIQ